MPGLGQVNWEKFISTLNEIGYEGVVSIEHEDPDYEGSEEKIKQGLKLGNEYLEKLLQYYLGDRAHVKLNDGREFIADINTSETVSYGDGVKGYWGVSHTKQLKIIILQLVLDFRLI